MPSLNDFGLGPDDAPESERRPYRRYDDESGARRLPSEAYGAYEPFDDDDVVELPPRSNAGFYFGIGAGLGVALLAIGSALYFGGYIDRPALGPAPQASVLVPETRLAHLEEAMNAEALALARTAEANLPAAPIFAAPPAVESPDIRVIDEPTAAPPTSQEAPTRAPRPSNLTEELEALDRAQPTPSPAPMPAPAQPTAPAETAPPSETSPPPNPY
jgi:hypothetical protein